MDVVTEDDQTIIGEIRDSRSGEPAHFAVVIFYQVNQTDTVNAVFDSKFTHTIHDELKRIEVHSLGYKTPCPKYSQNMVTAQNKVYITAKSLCPFW